MLLWMQQGNELEARTYYGTYKVNVTPTGVSVRLDALVPAMSFVGEHPTVGQAKAAAEQDEEYRTHIWETL